MKAGVSKYAEICSIRPMTHHHTLHDLGHHVVLQLAHVELLAEDPELAQDAGADLAGRAGGVVGIALWQLVDVAPLCDDLEETRIYVGQSDVAVLLELCFEAWAVEAQHIDVHLSRSQWSCLGKRLWRAQCTSKTRASSSPCTVTSTILELKLPLVVY